MEYNLEYFVEKFEKIPDNEWTVDIQVEEIATGKYVCCALGHTIPIASRDKFPMLTASDFEEGKALLAIPGVYSNLAHANNGNLIAYPQCTPKERSIAFLKDLIKKRDGIHN